MLRDDTNQSELRIIPFAESCPEAACPCTDSAAGSEPELGARHAIRTGVDTAEEDDEEEAAAGLRLAR